MTRRQFLKRSSSLAWLTLGFIGCQRKDLSPTPLPTEHHFVDLTEISQPSPIDSHRFTIPATYLSAPPADGYTATTVPANHTVALTQQQLQDIASGNSVSVESVHPDSTGHFHTFIFQIT